jgi:arsenate reductase (thioredoxin)
MAGLAVSTCSEEVCPITPGVRRISWDLPDPKDLPIEQVRPIRDEINRRVDELVEQLDAASTTRVGGTQ